MLLFKRVNGHRLELSGALIIFKNNILKMKQNRGYLMKGEGEALRLDIKTDSVLVEKQVLWAGIEPGMRVADRQFREFQINLSRRFKYLKYSSKYCVLQIQRLYIFSYSICC